MITFLFQQEFRFEIRSAWICCSTGLSFFLEKTFPFNFKLGKGFIFKFGIKSMIECELQRCLRGTCCVSLSRNKNAENSSQDLATHPKRTRKFSFCLCPEATSCFCLSDWKKEDYIHKTNDSNRLLFSLSSK